MAYLQEGARTSLEYYRSNKGWANRYAAILQRLLLPLLEYTRTTYAFSTGMMGSLCFQQNNRRGTDSGNHYITRLRHASVYAPSAFTMADFLTVFLLFGLDLRDFVNEVLNMPLSAYDYRYPYDCKVTRLFTAAPPELRREMLRVILNDRELNDSVRSAAEQMLDLSVASDACLYPAARKKILAKYRDVQGLVDQMVASVPETIDYIRDTFDFPSPSIKALLYEGFSYSEVYPIFGYFGAPKNKSRRINRSLVTFLNLCFLFGYDVTSCSLFNDGKNTPHASCSELMLPFRALTGLPPRTIRNLVSCVRSSSEPMEALTRASFYLLEYLDTLEERIQVSDV